MKLKKGNKVSLPGATPCFAGITPAPVPPGTNGTILKVVGNLVEVEWDTGYTTCHHYSEVEKKNGEKR